MNRRLRAIAVTSPQARVIQCLKSLKRAFAIAVFSLGVSSPLHAQTRVEVSSGISDCLNFRTRPETTALIRACLAPKTQGEVVDAVPYWLRLRLSDGELGWAAKRFLVELEAPPPEANRTSTPTGGSRQDAWLEVHVVDVGQGDGIWIRTFDDSIPGNGVYEGRNIVIDGGPDASDARNEMLRYLNQRYSEGGLIDALIVTHPHVDHFPGAEGVLRHFEVSDYYDPGFPKVGSRYNNFLQLVGSETAAGRPIRMHMGKNTFGVPDWGGELRAEFLYSYPGPGNRLGTASTLENNASIVLKLTYGDVSFLFMGDAEGKNRSDSPSIPKYAERLLLDEFPSERLRSTVLKIAHHGSETSSTLPFINAVDPEILLVSSGRKPYSGTFLPDRSTLKRYCTHNPQIRIYRTDQDDATQRRTAADDQDGDHIVLRTNGATVVVQAYEGGQPIPNPTACSP